MALPYTDWPEVTPGTARKWTIKSPPGATDVGQYDELTISFNTAGTKIRVKSITCTTHSPAHDAKEWLNMDCDVMASNRVVGQSFSGDYFELESSEAVGAGNQTHNKLTCRVIKLPKPGPLGPDPGTGTADYTVGAVCWTAEDG